jgi:WD40 repeat protein
MNPIRMWGWTALVALILTLPGRSQEPQREPRPAKARVDLHGDPLPEGSFARLGTLRLHHDREVDCVTFSPNGKLVASATRSEAKVWDVATGQELDRFRGKLHAEAEAVAFSPDSKTLLTADFDNTLRCWDVETGKLTKFLPMDQGEHLSLLWATFSPDRKLLALIADKEMAILDVATCKPLFRLRFAKGQEHSSVAISPDGRTLAIFGRDNLVRLWDIVKGKQLRTLNGHTKEVCAVEFSPDGKSIGSAAGDDLRLWDVAAGREIRRFDADGGPHAGGLASFAFAPDGRTLATGSGNSIRLWDVATGKQIRQLTGHGSWYIPGLAFSADGRQLVSGSRDHTILIWDVATGKPLHHFQGHRGAVISLSFAPDGKTLASGGDEDQTLIIWDIAAGKPRHVLPGHKDWVSAVAYSPDGKIVVSGEGSKSWGEKDRRIRAWDAGDGRLLPQSFGQLGSVQSLTFSPDGKALASTGLDAWVRVWDAGSGKRRLQLDMSDNRRHIAFSPDSKSFLVVEASGGRVTLHRTEDGEKLRELGEANRRWCQVLLAAFLAGGKQVLTVETLPKKIDEGPAAEARVWDVAEGRVLRSFPVPFSASSNVAAALSPDGKILAFSDEAGVVQLWDVESGMRLIGLRGHSGWVVSLAFAPDGKTLASGSWDTTVLL